MRDTIWVTCDGQDVFLYKQFVALVACRALQVSANKTIFALIP